MKLIKCSFFDEGDDIYINIDAIEAIFEDELSDTDETVTKILTTSGAFYIDDSVKEVIAKISLAQVDRDYIPPKVIKETKSTRKKSSSEIKNKNTKKKDKK